MHAFETVVRLQHTDSAGIVFYARFFELAHLAYEDLLETVGHPLSGDLGSAELILPIVRATSDYRAALTLGERVCIDVAVREVKSRSFTLGYRFVKADGSVAAVLETVHMAVDRAAGRSTHLPDALAAALRAGM